MKFSVVRGKHSDEIDVYDVTIVDAVVVEEVKVTNRIALGFVIGSAVFLVGAAIQGILCGDFSGLRSVAEYVHIPFAFILGHYFAR